MMERKKFYFFLSLSGVIFGTMSLIIGIVEYIVNPLEEFIFIQLSIILFLVAILGRLEMEK